MHYRLKEKKSKAVMRLAKRKDKDPSGEARTVEGVTRLICLSKGQTPLKGEFYFSKFALSKTPLKGEFYFSKFALSKNSWMTT